MCISHRAATPDTPLLLPQSCFLNVWYLRFLHCLLFSLIAVVSYRGVISHNVQSSCSVSEQIVFLPHEKIQFICFSRQSLSQDSQTGK